MAVDGEVVRVVVEYDILGASTVLNVFYFRVVGSVDDGEILADMEGWAADPWGTAWAALAEDGNSIIGVAAEIVGLDGSVQRNLGSSVLAIAGDIDSTSNIAAAAACIFANTALPKTRGRKFLPGTATQSIAAGRFTAGFVTLLADSLAAYLASVDGAGTYTPGVLRTVSPGFEPFVGSGGFDDIPDNQSRRRPDRGG